MEQKELINALQVGVRFELENGVYISIQQKKGAQCNYNSLTSCEVGIFYNDEYDSEDCIGYVNPKELITLLDCAMNEKEIPAELLARKIQENIKMIDTLDQIVDNYYLNAEMPNYEE